MPTLLPELENPPEVFYNATEARRYTVNTRVQKIQRDMAVRTLELLSVDSSALLLDVGCGSGISGEVLTEKGHTWVGVDISRDMLRIAKEDDTGTAGDADGQTDSLVDGQEPVSEAYRAARVNTQHVKWGLITSDDDASAEGSDAESNSKASNNGVGVAASRVEVVQNDIGQGVPFRPGSFDGCISVSAIQWLCHSSRKGDVPQRRLMALFQSLYNALRRGAKAAMQFYPTNPEQIHMITRAAMKCGFSGGVVIDFPHSSKAKKHYLVLQAGQVAGGFVPPPALTDKCTRRSSDEDEDDEEDDEEYEEDEFDGTSQRGDRIEMGKRDRVHAKHAHARSGAERKRRRKDNRPATGSRDWVLLKKAERRRRGLATTADSKYTLRPRKPRF